MIAPFVGTWRLVSYVVVEPNGHTHPVWDDHPLGQLVYTADGQMSAQVYDGRRRPLHADAESASAESVRSLYVGSVAYFGTYDVDDVARRITHLVEGSLLPDWIGGQQERAYRFLSDDILELSLPGFALRWQRVRE